MEDHDPQLYWECSLCEEYLQFKARDAFEEHVSSVHGQAITDLTTFVKVSSCRSLMGDNGCPLCSFPEHENGVSEEQLLMHVAEHVHSFSLNALPLRYDSIGETEAEMTLYFRSNNYFAESDANTSLASCGTDEEQTLSEKSEASPKLSLQRPDEQSYGYEDSETRRQKDAFKAGIVDLSGPRHFGKSSVIDTWSSVISKVMVALIL